MRVYWTLGQWCYRGTTQAEPARSAAQNSTARWFVAAGCRSAARCLLDLGPIGNSPAIDALSRGNCIHQACW
jgi:hypothetical protein